MFKNRNKDMFKKQDWQWPLHFHNYNKAVHHHNLRIAGNQKKQHIILSSVLFTVIGLKCKNVHGILIYIL